jgi:hypothetical protein
VTDTAPLYELRKRDDTERPWGIYNLAAALVYTFEDKDFSVALATLDRLNNPSDVDLELAA